MQVRIPNQDSGVIMVVEDPRVSRFVGKVLERAGYSVLELNPQPALNAARSVEFRVRLVITNVPHVFAEGASEIPLLYLAAEPDRSLAKRFGKIGFLRKPFLPEQLIKMVHEITGPV